MYKVESKADYARLRRTLVGAFKSNTYPTGDTKWENMFREVFSKRLFNILLYQDVEGISFDSFNYYRAPGYRGGLRLPTAYLTLGSKEALALTIQTNVLIVEALNEAATALRAAVDLNGYEPLVISPAEKGRVLECIKENYSFSFSYGGAITYLLLPISYTYQVEDERRYAETTASRSTESFSATFRVLEDIDTEKLKVFLASEKVKKNSSKKGSSSLGYWKSEVYSRLTAANKRGLRIEIAKDLVSCELTAKIPEYSIHTLDLNFFSLRFSGEEEMDLAARLKTYEVVMQGVTKVRYIAEKLKSILGARAIKEAARLTKELNKEFQLNPLLLLSSSDKVNGFAPALKELLEA